LKCKSIIEIEKELRKGKHEKKWTFCPGLAFPVGKPGQQGFPNRDKSTGVFLSQKVKKRG